MTFPADRTANRETALGNYNRDRNLYTPGWIYAPSDEMWWTGNQVSHGTTLTITGSQTITETIARPEVAVTSIASISANDLNCVLFPRTISVGQTWACVIRNQTTTTNAFLMSALVFTDGTTSAANVVASMAYQNTNGNFHHGCWHGTLTNVATGGGDAAILGIVGWRRGYWMYSLTYVGANSFNARFGTVGDTVADSRTSGDTAKTITPTHVGIAWSNWGGSPGVPEVDFGPIFRLA